MANIIKNAIATTSVQDALLDQINDICLSNPQSDVTVQIKKLVDSRSVPMQMDRDLLRRLTQPVINPHDLNFNLPISALTKNYQ